MAVKHTLVLDFDAVDVHAMNERGVHIAIAKPAGIVAPNVVWLAIRPSLSSTITWDDTYGIFAADVPNRAGARIDIRAFVHPAIAQTLYPFLGAAFGDPVVARDVPRGHYDVRNASSFRAAFGLLQAADVDGALTLAPVNAAVVPARMRANFSAVEDVFVWLQADVSGGTAIAGIPPEAIRIRFAPNDTVKLFRYETAAAAFAERTPPRADGP
jgi:hypothetical protein